MKTSTTTGLPWLLYGLLTCSLGLNLTMVLKRPLPRIPPAALAQTDAPDPMGDLAVLAESTPVPVPVEVIQPVDLVANPTPTDPSWTITEAEVAHSLSRTFTEAVGDDGAALSAHFARLFHWDLDLRKDLRKGDRIVVAWRVGDEGLEIAAASLTAGKLRKTLTGYRWTRPGDGFPSYWMADGQELARRLAESPMSDYELVTALVRDRPNHRGMDFKAPEGTPILATRAGTVTRVNWKRRANGRCIELAFPDGAKAKYLHLSQVDVRPGQQVAAGAPLGLSGNTGRTTAPHLHYQIDHGRRLIDPVDYHRVTRRAVSQGDMDAFQNDVARLDALLGNAMARR
jgi:murein DD-endopeptidase